jgi:cytochrome bd-type quinol oxidase subunit 2
MPSLVVALLFAGIHLPTYFVGGPVTGERVLTVLAQRLVIIPFAVFCRILITWVCKGTACSVLLAATLHASFNTASGSGFLQQLGTYPAVPFLPLLAVVLLACLGTATSKGRFDHNARLVSR